jgi:SAM-dependent methyltransferase
MTSTPDGLSVADDCFDSFACDAAVDADAAVETGAPAGLVETRLSPEVAAILACPICRGPLAVGRRRYTCTAGQCGARFPVVGGVPVLINEARSVFRIADFLDRRPTFFKPAGRLRQWISRIMPDVSWNVAAAANFRRLAELVAAGGGRGRVLVVGGSILGSGIEGLVDDRRVQPVETDVALGPRTQVVCDVHDLPFQAESFDAVVVQAVLEHVVDPQRAVAEVHRVLCARGLVYAETPFMQQVHGREFDFQRYTRLGHRRLLRAFDEIDSGIACGPGTALAWSARYFALSFFSGQRARRVVSALSRLSLFWLKYFDRLLARRPSALDAASALYFLGRKSPHVLSDRELVASYRGGL